ncbi:MAG: lysine--tRNA ligase [Actinomycetota bacterium]|nr:lysine--tRNA ligase [Actinomycetota bacterium]
MDKESELQEDINELMRLRRQKLEKIRASGENPFKSKFSRTHLLEDIIHKYSSIEPGEHIDERVTVAGRIMAIRRHGKASFAVIKDRTANLQLFLSFGTLGEKRYKTFLEYDIGDIVGVGGKIFKTKRGELSIDVDDYTLLTKSLRPLPEKWHGLKDVETRYRQRYVDLIINPHAKETLLTRTKVVKSIREWLDNRNFIEVETPMLQAIPGGAMAKPFVTHHEALDIDLYMRIAPELYLKRLIVGDLERVYELNRNFRNEGLSVRHNPEFTMLEVYQAYADYKDMMDLCEELVKYVAEQAVGSLKLTYQGQTVDLSRRWQRLTMIESIERYAGVKVSFDQDIEDLRNIARKHEIEVLEHYGKGKIINEIFEKLVEGKLWQPTFITDYPTEISPLAKKNPDDPNITERFELIIIGLEIGTAFSELTDPIDQRARFEAQIGLREFGDEEVPRQVDEDFIRALEYGMPPTGGLGIGIDRLVMLLTDNYSIREVISFPHMRPEKAKS